MKTTSARLQPHGRPISIAEAFRFWLKLGFISFGGPAGQIAIMHQELVEKRRWISERRFLHALNYCMLLPGPEAQQLATYIGWLMHRTWGGIVAGGLFVLPSVIILIALSWVYLRFGDVPWVAGIFYGIKPAVTAIVLAAAHRIGSRTLRNPWLWAIAIAAFAAIFALGVPFPAIVPPLLSRDMSAAASLRRSSRQAPVMAPRRRTTALPSSTTPLRRRNMRGSRGPSSSCTAGSGLRYGRRPSAPSPPPLAGPAR